MQRHVRELSLALSVWAGLIPMAPALAEDQASTGQAHYRPAPETGQPDWIAWTADGDGVLRFDAVVAGRPVNAMADTGATFTALDRRFAETLGAKVAANAQAIPVVGTGGPASAYPGPTIDLTFPSYTIERLPTAILDLAPLRADGERPIDMMLGLDVLGSGALELDLAGHGWRLWPSGVQWQEAATAPLHRSETGFYTFVTIPLGARPLRLWVDTGAMAGLRLTAAAAETIAALKQGRRTSIAAQGVNGMAVETLVIPSRLTFGAAELSEVPVQIEGEGGDAQPEGFDGMIGLGLLQRLHAVLDVPAGTFLYAADTATPKPLVRSTIGLQTGWDGGGVVVRHVMANSPAASGGWRAGDRICAVDGAPVTQRAANHAAYPWSVKPAGTKLTFRLCDGTERALVAQDFY
ncbi:MULTISPECIES: retropepsin-like aspartic protease [unclassified Methylobacterium]|jgi:predicted aspartyl protease|uniref:retropepsin-like aspartic protease n=1 Tax=unclassified Methylobacterium TaxID=2615210 RepID=UPI001353CC80|nr:aspartyl protease family protein [Methylobacterium sp. 2A]MWV22239.1 PDZ domain-containing protein [Methylobacterium sp. 2A]